MRTVVAVSALVLVAGCSGSDGDGSQQAAESAPSASSPRSAAISPPSATTTSPSVPTTPPPADAPVAAVISWVQAGSQVELGGFHTATRDGVSTDLGDDVAFITPSGKTQCRTDATMTDGALACLVELTDPPAQPAQVYGQWVGNWVDFDGASAQVGSVHGDPGPFTVGTGTELPYGSALRFGDYQCRMDPTGLYCINFARQTALQMSDAGVVPFGCLDEVAPPVGAGIRYECG